MSQLLRTRDFMDANVRDALVTGFESLIPSLTLPDPNDRHVLAAAIRCQADVIVTFNLKDFPSDYLLSFDVEAQHPDEFILYLLDLYPVQVCRAVEKARQRLKNPTYRPRTVFIQPAQARSTANSVISERTWLFRWVSIRLTHRHPRDVFFFCY